MINHKQTISVIIPAHNEEQNLRLCLDSLIAQNEPVDEIIVISNASTDKTAKIAKSYKDIKVIEVEEKGLINARDIGFNSTKCDILARINADVICSPDWSKVLRDNFIDNNVSAVAGIAKTWTMIFLPNLLTTFWSRVYLNFAEAYFGIPILWGSNMAIRKSAWLKIKNKTCKYDNDVHEDQDLSIHISSMGGEIVKDTRLTVINKEESYFNLKKYLHYNHLRKKTKKSHLNLIKQSKQRLTLYERFLKISITIIPGAVFSLTIFLYGVIGLILNYLFGKRRQL